MAEKIVSLIIIGCIATTIYIASGVFDSINLAMRQSNSYIESIK